MKTQNYKVGTYWMDLFLRLLSLSWIALAIVGMAPFFRFGFDRMGVVSWIAISVITLLILFGSFGAARKRWAQVGLLVPVFITFLYALDVCYAYLWHARFSGRFWEMLALVAWSMLTAFGSIFCLGAIIFRRDSASMHQP